MAIAFFVAYNVYLVDRSMVNLRYALEKAALEVRTVEDFNKIRNLLKVPLLKEIARTGVPSKELTYLELADNIAASAKDEKQVEDLKLCLRAILQSKEKERSGLLNFMDKVNTAIFGSTLKVSRQELLDREKKLTKRISATKNKQTLQALYYELGNVYLGLSELQKAAGAFVKSYEIAPKTDLAVKAAFNLAWTYKQSGEYSKAIELFTQIATDHPKDKLALRSEYELADTLYKKGDYEKARDYYAKISRDYADSKEDDLALFQAGYISYYNLNDIDAAMKYFSRLEELYPKALVSGHTKSNIRKVMASDYNKQAYRLLAEKDYTQALVYFDKALEVAPSLSRSIAGKGLAYYWLDDRERALEKARQAMEIPLEEEVAAINGLFVFINCKEIEEAIKLGEAILDSRTMQRSEFYYNLGYAYVIKANVDRAYKEFNRSIRINPDFTFAYNNLGCSYWTEKKYSAAINKFREAIDRGDDYAAPHFNLGVAYFYLSRYRDAYKEFTRALEIDPQYIEAKEFIKQIDKILNSQ